MQNNTSQSPAPADPRDWAFPPVAKQLQHSAAFDGNPDAEDAARRLTMRYPAAMWILLENIHWLDSEGAATDAPQIVREAVDHLASYWSYGWRIVLAHLTAGEAC